MLARGLFARYVKEALADLNNPLRLEMSPLASLLAADRPGEGSAARGLRQILRETIEALRPEVDVPADHPEWIGYHLLCQRYLQGIGQIATCERLGLSRATYYRRHQELARASAGMLWERYRRLNAAVAAEPEAPEEMSPDERARTEAVRLARESQPTLFEPGEVVQGVIETVLPLARQQGIELSLRAADPLPLIYGDPMAFRQVFLNLLTEGIRLAAGQTIEFLASPRGKAVVWRLRGLDEARLPRGRLEAVPGLALVHSLLEVYGGRLWLDRRAPRDPALCLCVPAAAAAVILVIDDDADTVSLYRRYLEIHGYVLQAARSGAEAWRILAESRPDLILLDVLMPKEDGWGILQRIKTMPEAADIPVVICSVLSQPQLALALGAARVMRKPITADALVQTLRALLGREGT